MMLKNVFYQISCCFLVLLSIEVLAADEPLRTLFTGHSADIEKHPNFNYLDLKGCGRNADNRISNGDKTRLREFPWMALLNYEVPQVTTKHNFLCGGTIITAKYVLTAAHCVKLPYKLVSVRLGEYDLKMETDCENIDGEDICSGPVQDISVESFVSHRNYNKPRYANDIALIRLEKPADFTTESESVQPICLPATEKLRNQQLQKLFVTGWGTTETGVTSNTLLKATIVAIKREQCQQDFKQVFIQEGQLCAISNNSSNSCQGDSGGPLQFPGVINKMYGPRYIQYGVVSFGLDGCGKNKYASGVYCRVSSYMNWILDNLLP